MKSIAYDIERPLNPVVEQSLQPWLTAQRIGVSAYWTMVSKPMRTDVTLVLGRTLDEYLRGDDDIPNLKLLFRLPPSILHILNALLKNAPDNAPQHIKELQAPITETLVKLNANFDSLPSFLMKARIVAHHILYSTVSAHSIVFLSASLVHPTLRRAWQKKTDDTALLEDIDRHLDVLRNPRAFTIARLQAINELSKFLGRSIWYSQVTNILLTRTFYWPLLISKSNHNIAFSLPIAIDIEFDEWNRIVPVGIRSREGTVGKIDISDWHEHFQIAVEAALTLWQAEHGNYGLYRNWRRNPQDFRYQLAHASILFNFYWANRILPDFPLHLDEGSADSYFAMAVLAKFLGRQSHLSSTITGLIGNQCRSEYGQHPLPDFWVQAPGGVGAKLRYAFASNTFERVVFPKDDRVQAEIEELIASQQAQKTTSVPEQIQITQTAQMASGVKLSHFADIVQVDGWKHYRYIRCPELSWGIHETHILDRPRLIDFNDMRVQSVLDLLRREHKGAILDLIDHEEVTPLRVASVLWHINTKLRGVILNDRPPRFSYLCIRVTPEQTASQFWEVFWRTIGAPFSAFEQFAHAPSSAQASLLLAQALNTFQPLPPSFSYRAPDIIVIIGAEHFQSISESEHPIPDPLSVPDILDHIKSLTLLSTAPTVGGLERFLGHTRIILIRDVPDAGSEGRDTDESEIAFKRLGKQEYPALCALSTFRWGFTHTMASLMLSNKHSGRFPGTGIAIRSFLLGLVRKGALRTNHGWYHLPTHLRNRLQSIITDDTERASYHLSAGAALAPYTMRRSVPSLAFDQAFLPEHVYEALFHLERVEELAKNIDDTIISLSNEAHALKVRLLQFAVYPTIDVVCMLADSHRPEAIRYAYVLGKTILGLLESNSSVAVHPRIYIDVINAALLWRKSGDVNTAERIARLDNELGGANGLFERAYRACEHTQFANTRNFNHLLVLSYKASYLEQKGWEYQAQLDACDHKIREILTATPTIDASCLQGEWFERVAGQIETHTEALRFYEYGVRFAPKWHQLWILAFGTESLAYQNVDRVLSALDELAIHQSIDLQEPVTREGLLVYIIHNVNIYWKQPSNPAPWIKQRWNTGVAVIQDKWGIFPEVWDELQKVVRFE